MYLNVWQPRLQRGAGAAAFFTAPRACLRLHGADGPDDQGVRRGHPSLHRLPRLELVHFGKERRDHVTQRSWQTSPARGGAVRGPGPGEGHRVADPAPLPRRRQLIRVAGGSRALVNYFYFYCVDADFGPFFSSLHVLSLYRQAVHQRHEWAKRQAARAGISFEALDNGFASSRTPAALQAICDRLGPATSRPCCASGCASCRTRSLAMTSPPATATSCRSCRPSSP